MSQYLRAGNSLKPLLFAAALCGFTFSPSAIAKVYPTSITLNGSRTNTTAHPGESVAIDYILNEEASAGVVIQIKAGNTTVRTLTLGSGQPGTFRGLNTVLWDGQDGTSNNVPIGSYSVSVTAASSGFPNWTHIIADNDPNTYVYDGRGIAVDRNPASPAYGRVFVANAALGISPADTPGDSLGILQFNSDSSAPTEGITNTVPYAWTGGELSPRKLEFGSGDRVYALDLSQNGQVLSWTADFDTNSFLTVLDSMNRPFGARLNGFAQFQNGTSNQLWATDNLGTYGVLRWVLTTDGTCDPSDLGTTVVGYGETATGLSLPPQDVALDNSGNIYVCQSVTTAGQETPTVLRFPAYDPSTNGGAAEVLANWAVGGGTNTYGGASAIAVDPTSTYVAVSFEGVLEGGFPVNGNTKVLFATNGAVAAEIDFNLAVQGDFSHQDTDCAWDAVGNLYYIDNYWGRWRAVSPPGTNQASTTALGIIQVVAGQTAAPNITRITVSNPTVTILFTGDATDLPAQFKLLATANLSFSFAEAAGYTITQITPGNFQASVPVNGPSQFYRIQR